MRWTACVHTLDLDLYSHLKEFLGNGVRTHVNSKGTIPSTKSSEEDRTHDAALLRTPSPTHYWLSYSSSPKPDPRWILTSPSHPRCSEFSTKDFKPTQKGLQHLQDFSSATHSRLNYSSPHLYPSKPGILVATLSDTRWYGATARTGLISVPMVTLSDTRQYGATTRTGLISVPMVTLSDTRWYGVTARTGLISVPMVSYPADTRWYGATARTGLISVPMVTLSDTRWYGATARAGLISVPMVSYPVRHQVVWSHS